VHACVGWYVLLECSVLCCIGESCDLSHLLSIFLNLVGCVVSKKYTVKNIISSY